MESIEKLRDYANEHIINGPLMNAMIDEIEREIEASYMQLPSDADGVPIRVGDEMEAHGEVLFVAHDKVVFEEDNASPVYRYAKGQRHVKPDPIKELLEELVAKVENDVNWRFNASDEIDCMTARIREAVEK